MDPSYLSVRKMLHNVGSNFCLCKAYLVDSSTYNNFFILCRPMSSGQKYLDISKCVVIDLHTKNKNIVLVDWLES
jgi:hypothetical protein